MKRLLMIPLLLLTSMASAQSIDPMEYATGNLNAQQQLVSYPLPRFKPGHNLNRNFIWFSIEYYSGWMQPNVTTPQAVNNSKVNAVEFYKNWNFYFPVSSNIGTMASVASYTDTINTFPGALTNIAKRNPGFKTSAICFWPQIGGNVSNKNLSNNHYIQNSSGQFLDENGNVSSRKVWSPLAPNASIAADGVKQRGFLQNLVTALGRPIDIINENGEILPVINKNGTAISSDPRLAADKASLGNLTATNYDYIGYRFAVQTKLYRDSMMKASPGTIFTHYGLDGQTDYRFSWPKSRDVGSMINGRYYPTGDLYPRWPTNWRSWSGPWHGLGWFADCKYFEMQAGDSLMSPFVCAGWDNDETKNIRPAQYLALLKVLSAWGSEFFYSSFFSLQAPFPDPKNWGWQAVMPVYAQGVTSRFEEYLKAGTLLNGDVPRNFLGYVTLWPNNPKYLFHTGDNRQLVAVRKLNNANKYVITTAQMVDANTTGNAPMVSYGKFKLGNDSLFVGIRRQGSVYIYDASNPSEKVFYQLDGWHQYEHPEHWSADFNFEAELFDNNAPGAQIKTEVPLGTAPGDYRNFTSYVTFNGASPATLEYNFNGRKSSSYNLWVRVRSKNSTGGSLSVKLNGQQSKTIGCITSTSWQWYNLDACSAQPISFTGLSPENQMLSLTATNNNLEIERITLTPANLNLNPNQPACGTSIATVNVSGPTTFCQGGSVVLTAPLGNTYNWTNGQTTRSITVSQTGAFSVSVSNGTGCASVSAPVQVTVQAAPAVSIQPGGPTTICPGSSVSLSAPNGNSYLWSNGSTTRSITVNSAGNYVVTITGSNGCTAASSPLNVSITTLPIPTITTSGPTNLAPGQSVTLTSSAGTSYLWQPGGQTTSSITVSMPGNYSVTVSNNTGCSATSNAVIITHQTNPGLINISSTGSTEICQGRSVGLNASGGHSYVWTPGGQTTASITVSQTGVYSVVSFDQNGLYMGSDSITVSPLPMPMNPYISITYFPATAFQLNAHEPSAVSYHWSTGATSASIQLTQPQLVSVSVTNAFGCTSGSTFLRSRDVTPRSCVATNMLTAYDLSDSSAMLGWNPAISAERFIVHYRVSGTSTVNKDEIAGTLFNWRISKLLPATNYEWWIESKCVSGSFFSSIATFKTLGQPLSCGSLPQHFRSTNITTSTAEIQWYATTSDTITIRYNEAGSSAYKYTYLPGNPITTSTVLNRLRPNTYYECQISSSCSGYTTPLSPAIIFKTLDTCGYPGQVSVHDITPSTATIRWTNITPMDTIRIRYRRVSTGAVQVIYLNGMNQNGSYILRGLRPDNAYTVELSGKCRNVNSAWTLPVSFTTNDISTWKLDANNPLNVTGYPNPATQILFYSFTFDEGTDYIVKVCDLSGRELLFEERHAEAGNNVDEIPVDGYAKGIYMLIVQKGLQRSHFRFSVQ